MHQVVAERELLSGDYSVIIQIFLNLVSVQLLEHRGNYIWTVNNLREGETHGKEYFFRERTEFDEKVKNGEFLEYVEYNNKCYGTEEQQVVDIQNEGKICILEIEMKGSKNVSEKRPDWNFIYIFPPSEEALIKRYNKDCLILRLEGRGTETKDVIANRVKIGIEEIREAKTLKYFSKTFINDDFEVFYEEFKEFLQSYYINQKF